ncbi:MAG TPA: hypothetical protein VMS32_11255 [Verrucomicrobiae bacterium]|nr:hypothetical protein [Verrucomicrobiae bacterium]
MARSDRRTTHYDDALMLARLLIAGQSRGPAFGGSTAWSFLIPTPDAVESAVRALLAERLQLPCVVTNRGRMLRPTALTVNPDLVFEPGLAVGDIKYKIDWEEMPRSDLYQAVSFASAYEMSKAALVSFKTTARRPLQDIPFGDVVVQHLCWDATQGTSPEDAADRLVRSVQQWLGIGPGVTVECAAR